MTITKTNTPVGNDTDMITSRNRIRAGYFFAYANHFLIRGGEIGAPWRQEEQQMRRRLHPPFFTGFYQVRRRIMPIWNPLISLALRDRLFSKRPLQSIFISSAGTFLSAIFKPLKSPNYALLIRRSFVRKYLRRHPRTELETADKRLFF